MSADDTTVNKDEPKEVQPDHIPSLDEVNELNKHKIEKDDADEDKDKDKAVSKDDEVVSDDDTSDDQPGAGDDNKPADKVPETAPPEAQPTPELDTEITKPGKNKVAIKNFEGKTYYFNNTDEIPDDFEPANYKSLMVGTKALMRKEDQDTADAVKAEEDAQKAEVKANADAMQKQWDADIKELKLDKDQENEVYDYMTAELKNGVALNNFKTAYKAMLYDKGEQDRADGDKDLADRKKARGARVQPGGTNTNKPISKIAPPQGLSLDQVHARVLRDLN